LLDDKTTVSEQIVDGELTLSAGTIVDERFRVGELVGRGGMCAVYEAQHLLLQRRVAIKLLHLVSIANDAAVARFQREAILAGELKHPNIIEMHGFGVWRSRPYIAMEFLEGRTLTQLVDQDGPLPEPRALRIFLQICDALAEAHAHHIVHRDLKPSNVIIVGENDQVKLVDFGIARLLPESSEEVQRLTQTGQVLGSFLYMAPEQCMGKTVDARTDLYAFGCLMYKALTGKTPFDSETPFELMGMHLGLAPPTVPGMSDRMMNIAKWCLRKDPKDRPQSAAQLKSVLLGEDLAETRSVEPGMSPVAIPKAPRRRKIVLAAIGSVILTGALCFAVFVLRPLLKPPAPADTAEAKALVAAVNSAESSKSPRDLALANLQLCKYFIDLQEWKAADDAGQKSIKAFKEAGDLTSPDSLWATYYTGLAAQSNGKAITGSGWFIRLSEDMKDAPTELKQLGALHAAECMITMRRPFYADAYFRRGLVYGEHGDQNIVKQTKLEYAIFISQLQFMETPKSIGGRRKEIMRQLLDDVIAGGTATPEDAARVETAKDLLAKIK
jgi:tRNA A-37 threonylcarbamoyl transferase component Bud32